MKKDSPDFVDMRRLNELHFFQQKFRINQMLRAMQPLWCNLDVFGMPFRIELCHICHAPHGQHTSDHVHPYLEWTIIRSGHLHCKIEGMEISLSQGQSLLTPPGVIHMRSSPEDDCELFGLMLSLQTTGDKNSLQICDVTAACHKLDYHLKEDPRLDYLLESIILQTGTTTMDVGGKSSNLIIIGHIVSILGLLWESLHPLLADKASTANQQADSNFAEAVCAQAEAYLRANLSFSPSVESTASFVGLSRRHLYRLFLQCRGITVSDCLSQIQFERAKDLLTTTCHSIKSITALCGFGSNVSYFGNKFRKHSGQSPQNYRKQHTR